MIVNGWSSREPLYIRVITKLPNSEQSYKGKVKTHKYINGQNQSHLAMNWVWTHNLSGDYTGSCKSNYHMITTMMVKIVDTQ
jgi:hypothetical protein